MVITSIDLAGDMINEVNEMIVENKYISKDQVMKQHNVDKFIKDYIDKVISRIIHSEENKNDILFQWININHA